MAMGRTGWEGCWRVWCGCQQCPLLEQLTGRLCGLGVGSLLLLLGLVDDLLDSLFGDLFGGLLGQLVLDGNVLVLGSDTLGLCLGIIVGGLVGTLFVSVDLEAGGLGAHGHVAIAVLVGLGFVVTGLGVIVDSICVVVLVHWLVIIVGAVLVRRGWEVVGARRVGWWGRGEGR